MKSFTRIIQLRKQQRKQQDYRMKTFETIVKQRITDGSLPKEYKDIPKLSSSKVPDGYTKILVPHGLTLEQWNILLKKTCNGLWYSSVYNNAPFKTSGWTEELIYSKETPFKTDITYSDADKEYTLCSVESYLALQWYLLETNKTPIDSGWSFSWLKNEPDLGLPSGVVPGGGFDPGGGRVLLDRDGAGGLDDYLGVRPSGRGQELEPLVSPSPLELEISEITINGKVYVPKDD